jgi:hypothetical protein
LVVGENLGLGSSRIDFVLKILKGFGFFLTTFEPEDEGGGSEDTSEVSDFDGPPMGRLDIALSEAESACVGTSSCKVSFSIRKIAGRDQSYQL